METTELAVGDSVAVEVQFLTGKRRGETSKGILITTSLDPSSFYIQIRAYVFGPDFIMTPVSFVPPRLFFMHYTAVYDTIADFEIINISEEEVGISLIDYPKSMLTVSAPSEIMANDTGNCQVQLLDPDFTESFNKSITFEVEDNYRFTIPIIGRYIYGGKVVRPIESGVNCGGPD